MSKQRLALGQQGENLASAHLQQLGMSIVERNYRQKTGEIDIIAKDRETLVFVEVKTRKTRSFGSPAEAVTIKKQQQISRTAMLYLSRNQLLDSPVRFDVVSILMTNHSKPCIELIQNAFETAE
ncbi:MAG: YraN family protein [Desulfobulbaceae bacterium]|uniref:UPF0102 protein H8E79_03825 n=1 Tax=Candidatus Desulfatifera sulfidica TaxID=2841691 RepID=A0A8J6TA47_9BACT|nr:YraN family protein [Candidatus Desulfatifera sulfidica]